MARWCPGCGSEYVEGYEECPSCGRSLAAKAPTRESKPFTPDDVIFIEPRAARTYQDPFVVIWEGSYIEGSLLVGKLQSDGIPVETTDAAEPGLMRVQVPKSYIDEAYAALDSDNTPGLIFVDVPDDASSLFDDPNELPPEPTMSPLLKGIIAAVAVLLIVALLVSY